MAQILCPKCGKSNPDLLDVCQFCQTPLKPDPSLRIGEKPTKKNTGELETVLPDWLKDVRQQARTAAEEDAAQAAARSGASKNEPPDLLAGLASQREKAKEEDVPDWLASLNPTPKPTASTPTAPEPTSDFFAQFNQKESKPEQVSKPPQEDVPSWNREEATIPFEKDELSEWFAQASERSEEIVEPENEQSNLGWGSGFDSTAASAEKATPKEEEDLSWLHNLEAAARQTGELQTPQKERDWTADFETSSTSSTSKDDLSWLDRLGGIEESSQPGLEQTDAPPAASQDDLSWLRRPAEPGGISEPPQASQPSSPREDLSWLNDFGALSEPGPMDAAQNQPIPPQPFAAEENLDWLNKLGGVSEPAGPTQPAQPVSGPEEKGSSEEDLSWLSELGGGPEPLSASPFAQGEQDTERVPPRQTAPLRKEAVEEPDWLKSAAEAPSMPAPGDLSMDWFAGKSHPEQEKTPSSAPQASAFESDIFATSSEPGSLSNQDVDSLFSVEMPEWLSQSEPEETAKPSSPQVAPSTEGSDESLQPVDLPSWVQAMRPVEAVITETAPSVEDQPAETEGPLAGLHGVIPIAPIGSSRRPKPVSLTLQTSDEQQASAVLLEEILGSETSPRALITSPVVTSQQWLRWALSGLFLLVLSAMLLLRSQIMPVSSILPDAVGGLRNAVISIPAGSKILVVTDYEPSLAGEMEAISGPLLDQLILLSQPELSFVSTSPNGAALADRLMAAPRIDQPGAQYKNLGYLPSGSAGILGFMENPAQIIPSAGVGFFSDYAALVILTDHAESGRVWVEQFQSRRAADPSLTNKPLLMIASAQAGPLLQTYVSSRQITGMISGLSDAARYEALNNNGQGMARSYWDTFGVGLMMSVTLIIIGSLWSLFSGIRERRANAEQG